jgi:hypothetical protein
VVFFVLAGFVFGMRPYDKVFSFGLGIYGLVCLAVVVLVVMRDPIWRYQADRVERIHV